MAGPPPYGGGPPPRGYGPPGGGGFPLPPPPPPPFAAGPPAPARVLYVGKLPPALPDPAIKALLAACGPVAAWTRPRDPDSGAPKAFGFAEFEGAAGVRAALGSLAGLVPGPPATTAALVVKPDSKTAAYLAWLDSPGAAAARRAAAEAAGGGGGGGEGSRGLPPAIPPPLEPAAADDAACTPEAAAARDAAVRAILAEHGLAPVDGQTAAAADEFLAGLGGEGGTPGAAADAGASPAAEQPSTTGLAPRPRTPEADKRAYRDAVAEWEREERRRAERLEAADAAAARAAAARAAAVRVDLEESDESDGGGEGLPAWRRRPVAATHRGRQRARRRPGEEAADAADREAEAAERLAADRAAADAAAAAARAAADAAAAVVAGAGSAGRSAASPPRAVSAEAAPPPPPRLPIAATLMAARQAPPLAAPRAFGGGEDDEGGRDAGGRALKKIRYSDAEVAAGAAPGTAAPLPPPPPPPPADDAAARKAALMALIKEVPVDRAAVFSHRVDWEALLTGPGSAAARGRLARWVGSKAVELLGAPSPEFVDGVMRLVEGRTPAGEAADELGAVLDEEAPDFVLKLYRTLILEGLKSRRGLG